MNCVGIRYNLYDFITRDLAEDIHKEINNHLKSCSGCRLELRELKESVALLDKWELPKLSKNFTKNVMGKIQGDRPKSEILLTKRKLFLKPWLIPIEAAALAGVVFLGFIIFRGVFGPKVVTIPREVKIELGITEVKNPIIIESENIELSFVYLNNLIQSHKGSIIDSKKIPSGMKVVFEIKENNELTLLKELKKWKRIQIPNKGYRDEKGNIVVVIKKFPTND